MKKAIIVLMALIVVISMSTAAFAQKLSQIRVDDDAQKGTFTEIHANVIGSPQKDTKKASLVFFMPEADIYQKSSTFYVAKNTNYGRYLDPYIPLETESGEYVVRVSLMHSGKTYHQWRIINVY